MLLLSAVGGYALGRDGSVAKTSASQAKTSASQEFPLVGDRELVEIEGPGGVERGIARIDTGAAYSSIDVRIAERIGLDEEKPDRHIRVRSALGRERRPIFDVKLRLGDNVMPAEVSVADRSRLTNPILVGRNELEGFHVTVGRGDYADSDDDGG
jgi:hypothetical protein